MEYPYGVSERIMCLRVHLTSNRYMSMISVYAPTMTSSTETIMAFYQDLKAVLCSIPKEDKIILLGDFNARVGKAYGTWSSLGRHGVGKMNSNGLCLLQLCSEFELAICNTFSHQKEEHKSTWTHPRSKHGHILDYIITRRRDIQDMCTVRVMRGAECGTDHQLVRGKFKLRIMRKKRSEGIKVPKRINVSKLRIPEVRETLQNAFENIECDGSWSKFKSEVYDSSVEVLGLKKRKHRDWFNENDSNINVLLERRYKLKVQYLNAPKGRKDEVKTLFREGKAQLQRELRRMKNEWWKGVSKEIQHAYNRKDSKELYHLIKQVFGPQSSVVVPMRSKDGTKLFKDPNSIMERWTEHFTDLFYNPSNVNEEIINNLDQMDIIPEMMELPSLDEIRKTISEINTGKAPVCIPVEILVHGGETIVAEVYEMICDVWKGAPVPQDWIDAILISIYKSKGSKSVCGDYRGISLLESVGKVFSKLLLDRLNKWICPKVIPESQCGYRSGRGTMDMIFSVRQLQEKCIEHHVGLYQVFVDLTKAFDTVNRQALWIILGKLGCPPEFVELFKQLHRDMKGRFNFNGSLSDPIAIDNGVKQGDIPAPILFSIYFAMALIYAFKNCDLGVYIRFITSGKVFNIRRFGAKTKVFEALIRELLYADDADFVAHTEHDLQAIINLFSEACCHFGLTISLKKTKVMYTAPPGQPYIEPNIFIQGTRLDVVNTFVYLGSSISRDGSLDSEVHLRIQKASKAFGKLEKRVWADKGITKGTKLSVYGSCVLTSLLYSSETWTTYRRHIQVLERFHQNCLRRILNIRWQSLTPDTAVLQQADTSSIEMMIIRNQMRWAGHLVRMNDARLPKQIFYSEMKSGKRPQHKPKKRFKDSIKSNMKQLEINIFQWEVSAADRPKWRRLIFEGCKHFEAERIEHCKVKRALRKQDLSAIPENQQDCHQCNICNRICLSKAGLASHIRSHDNNDITYNYQGILSSPSGTSCHLCNKVCRSTSGLKRHMKIHKESTADVSIQKGSFKCPLCQKFCKSKAGLKSHFRRHQRMNNLSNEESQSLMNAAATTTNTISTQRNYYGTTKTMIEEMVIF